MASCGITMGMDLTCSDKQNSAGGLKQRVYLANVNEIDDLVFDVDGYVTAITFDTYGGLYEFTGVKNGNSTTSDIQLNDSGIAFYPHNVTLSLVDLEPADKLTLEDLANSEVVAIVETSKQRFEIFGWNLGLTIESGAKTSGNTPEEASARELVLSGNQAGLEKVFSTGDYTTSKALLDSYVL